MPTPTLPLEHDVIRWNRHHALALCLSMIFSENRFPLFRIMLSSAMTSGCRHRAVVDSLSMISAQTASAFAARETGVRPSDRSPRAGISRSCSSASHQCRLILSGRRRRRFSLASSEETYVWGFQAARSIASPCGKWLVWLTKTRGSHHAGFTKTSNPACELAQDKPVNNLHAGVAVIEAGDRGE